MTPQADLAAVIGATHPLVLRRTPVAYTGPEVTEALRLLELSRGELAGWMGVCSRTIARMESEGAVSKNAAALNARLRLKAFGLPA